MRPFSYQRATAPAEALAAQGRFIAGGTNLLDLMKLQIETPDALVDINHIGLDEIAADGEGLRVGALVRNAALRFVCRPVALEVATTDSLFTAGYAAGATLRLPVAHHDGNFIADSDTLAQLADEDRIAFRYRDNPNGSAADIAGILSGNRRVLGMMPHPERAVDPDHGGTDGAPLFAGLAAAAGAMLQGA